MSDRPGYEDEFGFIAPLPMTSGQRKIQAEGFATGPGVGERLPDFELLAHTGELISLHAHRGGAKAAVVFFRSAVW